MIIPTLDFSVKFILYDKTEINNKPSNGDQQHLNQTKNKLIKNLRYYTNSKIYKKITNQFNSWQKNQSFCFV